jgi:hypothetical protein
MVPTSHCSQLKIVSSVREAISAAAVAANARQRFTAARHHSHPTRLIRKYNRVDVEFVSLFPRSTLIITTLKGP